MTDRDLTAHLERLRMASRKLPQKWRREQHGRYLEAAMRENAKQIIKALIRAPTPNVCHSEKP